jgi:hypothetical protein
MYLRWIENVGDVSVPTSSSLVRFESTKRVPKYPLTPDGFVTGPLPKAVPVVVHDSPVGSH